MDPLVPLSDRPLASVQEKNLTEARWALTDRDVLTQPGRLAGFGFVTSSPIYKFVPSFSVDDIKSALFDSDLHEVKPLELVIDVMPYDPEDNDQILVPYRMAVELVQTDHWPMSRMTSNEPHLGDYRAPSWYIRGVRLASPLVHLNTFDVLHVYILVDGTGSIEYGAAQLHSCDVVEVTEHLDPRRV